MLPLKRFQWWALGVLLALLVLTLAYFITLYTLAASHHYPLKRVEVVGRYRDIDNDTLQRVLAPYTKQGLFGLSEWDMARDLEAIPAVKSVSIWRIWPDTLRVSIKEREAIARFENNQLLASNGAVFTPVNRSGIDPLLPVLYGDANNAQIMLKLLNALSPLFQLKGLTITGLQFLDNRDSRLQVNHQFWIMLGHDDIGNRVNTFLQAYDALMANNPGHALASVDLRYAHGFAVRWV